MIHGIGGLNREMYFPKTKAFLEKLGLQVFMPSLGGYRENTSYTLWKDYFDKNLKGELGEDTIVIAQSVGTQFIVKYLCETGLKVGLYVSCCGPRFINKCLFENTLRDKFAFKFKLTKKEFEFFKNLDFPKHSFYSDNDNFFDIKNLEAYADAIGAEKHLTFGRAHFNFEGAENGVPELEEFLKLQI